jgi:hypothetical protein
MTAHRQACSPQRMPTTVRPHGVIKAAQNPTDMHKTEMTWGTMRVLNMRARIVSLQSGEGCGDMLIVATATLPQ